MEVRHKKLCEELEILGYYQSLSVESVPLVERLLADLVTTTESLRKYIKIAEKAIEEKNNLEFGARPLKGDNARLVDDYQDLNVEYLKYKKDNSRIQKELNDEIDRLKSSNAEAIVENEKLKRRLSNLTKDIIITPKTTKSSCCKLQQKPLVEKKAISTNNLCTTSSYNQKDTDMASLVGQKCTNLAKEVRKLKNQNLHLMNSNEVLQQELCAREKEIERLIELKGESRKQLSADFKKRTSPPPPNGTPRVSSPGRKEKNDFRCTCGNDCDCDDIVVKKIGVNKLLQMNSCLKSRLRDAVMKEREAMKRALNLSERNRLLENEMRDIDHLALAVESECNNTVKNNTDKMHRLQERMQAALCDAQLLRTENHKQNIEISELNVKLDQLQSEKKTLNSKIQDFNKIEHDLNMEIDRLSKLSKQQELQILEYRNSKQQSVSKKDEGKQGKHKTIKSNNNNTNKNKHKTRKNVKHSKSVGISNGHSQEPKTRKQSIDDAVNLKKCSPYCTCAEDVKDFLLKEVESIRTEKQFYMEEYQKMLPKLAGQQRRSSADLETENLRKLVSEQTASLQSLQHENKVLSQEKFNLMTRLDSKQDEDRSNDCSCLKTVCKRNQREIIMLRNDFDKLEKESTNLKDQLNLLTDKYKKEQRNSVELEQKMRSLESEKYQLQQESHTKTSIERECDQLQRKIKEYEAEITNLKTQIIQLKHLAETSSKSLKDSQMQVEVLEYRLNQSESNMEMTNSGRHKDQKHIERLQRESETFLNQLTALEKEKDELLSSLDTKTEKVSELERLLRNKEVALENLEKCNRELKEQLRQVSTDAQSKDFMMKSSQSDVMSLKDEVTSIRKMYENALQENRKLQNDLAAASCDCETSRRDLEIYKRQCEDLKTQLKHYIAEVKRTEDLISSKEIERNEILDQFRSLSQEANLLETNNHTLENEASHTRVQLSVALDHAADLERRIENHEAIIKSYEQQITELTNQMANFEIGTKQTKYQLERSEREMEGLKELNARLERENQRIKRELRKQEDFQIKSSHNAETYKTEKELLESEIEKEKNIAESLKNLWTQAKEECATAKFASKSLQCEVDKLRIEVQDLRQRVACCKCRQIEAKAKLIKDKSICGKTLLKTAKNSNKTYTTNKQEVNIYEHNLKDNKKDLMRIVTTKKPIITVDCSQCGSSQPNRLCTCIKLPCTTKCVCFCRKNT